jgi:hypothetical protein
MISNTCQALSPSASPANARPSHAAACVAECFHHVLMEHGLAGLRLRLRLLAPDGPEAVALRGVAHIDPDAVTIPRRIGLPGALENRMCDVEFRATSAVGKVFDSGSDLFAGLEGPEAVDIRRIVSQGCLDAARPIG